MIPVITLPGSKSITNRALVCAALARGTSRITGASDSDDTALLANGLNQLGVLARPSSGALLVEGTGGRLTGPKFPIPVGNAGTTTRFLALLAAVAEGTVALRLDPRMAERPLDELVDLLAALGVKAELHGPAGLLSMRRVGSAGGEIRVRSDRSSQFLSALMLAAPCLPRGVSIAPAGPVVSEPYVRMTVEVMCAFGVDLEAGGGVFRVPESASYRPAEFAVEPDASSATYFLAGALLGRSPIEIPGLRAGGSQPDAAFIPVVERMGGSVTRQATGVHAAGGGVVRGIDIDMNGMPDAVPTLAVTALFAEGPTRIRNAGHLRHKESDRLAALAEELARIGADIRVEADGLTVLPGPLRGGVLDPHDDHRLAMSFALLTLRVPGITIGTPECVRKSFPGFWEEFRKIQGA